MAHPRGWTIIELMVSLSLMSVLLGAVWSALTVGEAGFWTSESAIQAHQQVRHALSVIEDELAEAQVYSYSAQTLGLKKSYIKFRRVDPALVQEANGEPQWQALSQMRMIVWCGANTNEPCKRIDTPDTPARNQLLLLCAGDDTVCDGGQAFNENAEINQPWRIERVLSQELDVEGFDQTGQQPFTLTVYSADDVVVPHAAMPSCMAYSPWYAEACVNRNAHPLDTFGVAFSASAPDRYPAYVTVTIRTRARGAGVAHAVPRVLQRTILLRNPQGQTVPGP